MKLKLNSIGKKEVMAGYMEFMHYSKSKNLSDVTLFYYRKKLIRFFEWLINYEEIVALNEANENTVRKYTINLQVNYELNDKNTHSKLYILLYSEFLTKAAPIKSKLKALII
jgi:site-specific recombinase XerD